MEQRMNSCGALIARRDSHAFLTPGQSDLSPVRDRPGTRNIPDPTMHRLTHSRTPSAPPGWANSRRHTHTTRRYRGTVACRMNNSTPLHTPHPTSPRRPAHTELRATDNTARENHYSSCPPPRGRFTNLTLQKNGYTDEHYIATAVLFQLNWSLRFTCHYKFLLLLKLKVNGMTLLRIRDNCLLYWLRIHFVLQVMCNEIMGI